MYVTSEIKTNKKLISAINKYTKFKPYQIKSGIIVSTTPKHPSLIGNAFEVLFQIEIFKKKGILFDFRKFKAFRGLAIIYSEIQKLKVTEREKALYIMNVVQKHESIIYKYSNNYKIKKDDLYRSVLFLAYLGQIRDFNDFFTLKFKINKMDKDDLALFHKTINSKFVDKYSKNNMVFNQVIKYNELYGEIDLIIDNCIIDIKTTRTGYFSDEMYKQLIMYYFLLKKNGVHLKTISIYFARFDKEERININKTFIKNGEKKLENIFDRIYG